ncbi:MAG: LacI family DNA-binding transcriptional regulator [Kiritimatiellae bacterium]|nr:LacI family DNA-binding transcriptional regulator [Kiritimatiellia bacterium]
MTHTRNDIARLAGVSPATVSRVYNRPEVVSKDKVRRVLAAAGKVGYSPNKSASALRRKGTGVILFLERKPGSLSGEARFYAWFYADILRAVKSIVDETTYQISLYSYASLRDIARIRERNLCDAVICHEMGDAAAARAVRRLGLPYVCCFHTDHLDGFNRCFIDEIHGGGLAAEQFRMTGHRRPAHITGRVEHIRTCRQRWDGFRQGFDGVPVKLIDGELGIQGGYQSGRRLVPDIKAGQIDCVFVVNDLTCVGVVQAFAEAAIRVPRDVSLIAYDNLPFISTLPFKLATIDVSVGKAYREATRLLLKALREPAPIVQAVRPVFVPGESVQARRQP